MTREIKFRCWDKENKKWVDEEHFNIRPSGAVCKWEWNTWKFEPTDECIVAQYTGLKDKNGVVEIYEGDIMDNEGNIKGNIYENNLDKKETDTVIQGFGTKTWCETYRRAILLGCKDSQ